VKQEEAVTEAYQKSGLHLTETQRVQFRKRYVEERKKLEEELAKESQERRTAANTTIIEQLKKEFSTPKQSPSPTPSVALH
jgi:phage regulator Rha-like protein